MVKRVQEFCPEFKTHFVVNGKFLLQSDVQAVQARATNCSNPASAEGENGRIRIGLGTEPLQTNPWNELLYVFRASVAICARPKRVRSGIVVPVNGEGESAVQTVYRADVPAPDHRVNNW